MYNIILSYDNKNSPAIIITFDISSFNAIIEKIELNKAKNICSKLIKIFSNYTNKYQGILSPFISDFVFILLDSPPDKYLNSILMVKEIYSEIKKLIKEFEIDFNIKSIIVSCNIILKKEKKFFYKILEEKSSQLLSIFNIMQNYDIFLDKNICHNLKFLFYFEKIKDTEFYKIVEITKKEILKQNLELIGRTEEIKKLTKIFSEKKLKVLFLEGESLSGKTTLIEKFMQLNSDSVFIKIESSIHKYCFSIFKQIYIFIKDLIYSLNLEDGKKINNQINTLSIFFNNHFTSKIITEDEILICFMELLKKISRVKKIVFLIEEYQYIDDISMKFLNFLFKALKNSDIFFILSTKKLEKDSYYSNKKYFDYIKIEKLNILPYFEKVILEQIENLTQNKKEMLETIAIYGENIDIYLLKRILKNEEFDNILIELVNLNLLYEERGRYIYFKNKKLNEILLKTIPEDRQKKIHKNIATTLLEYCNETFYEKIAIHYEKAKDIKNAILYYFLASIRYRDNANYNLCIKLLDKSIDLANLLKESDSNICNELLYEKEIEIINYNILKPFWTYKIKFKLTITALYYFKLNMTYPYEKNYEELIEKLISDIDNDFEKENNFYIYILSKLEYFNYLLFNKFRIDLNTLSTIEESIKNSKNELLLAIFYSYYILLPISKLHYNELNIKNIVDNFLLSKEIIIRSKTIDNSTKNSFLAYWYDNYASYLRVENKNLIHIINKIKNGLKHCKTDYQKMCYCFKISGVLGALNNTKYQLKYLIKSLIYAKKSFSYINAMHCYSSLGYHYLLKGKYIKSLNMNKKSKKIAFLINDELELGMIYKNLGDLYLCLKEYKKAEKEYKNSIKYKERIESTKTIVDFNNIIFPKSSLCYALIKNKKFEEAKEILANVESNISRVFFGNEIPIFLNFLKQLFILKDKYCEESLDKIKKCYFDIYNINPKAVQLLWIKQELKEYGIVV